MNKKAMVIGVAMLLAMCGFASQAEEIIFNGDFKQLIDKKAESAKFVVGDKFISGWDIANDSAEVIKKEGEPNKLCLKNACIYSWMQRAWTAPAAELNGEITASGTGTVKIVLSTTVQKSADQQFTHSKRTELGEFALDNEAKTFNFKYKMEAGEVGYIYIYSDNGSALISHISAQTAKTEK